MNIISRKLLFLLPLFFIGCAMDPFPETETPFLRPVDESLVPITVSHCEPNEEGLYTEETKVISGEKEGLFWSEGGGCIQAPIREVWAKMNNMDLTRFEGMKDMEVLSAQSNLEDPTTHFYKVKYWVGPIDYTVDWYQTLKWGTVEDPGQVLVNFQKVDGTSHIYVFEGSYLLEAIDENVTGFTSAHRISGSSWSRIQERHAIGNIADLHDKLKAHPEKYPDRDRTPNWEAIGGK